MKQEAAGPAAATGGLDGDGSRGAGQQQQAQQAAPPGFGDGAQGFGDEGDDDAGKSKWDTSSDSEFEQMIKTKKQRTEQDPGPGQIP